MPPHCDSLDGPVVKAARRALEAGSVDLVLPYVFEKGWDDVREAFRRTQKAREAGGAARELADLWFFETVVRIHREGEGAPFTGLKPAGLDVGPVIPVAERSIESESPEELVSLLTGHLAGEIRARHDHVMHLKHDAGKGLREARAYVAAMLGLQVWSHSVHGAMEAAAHGDGHHEH